MRTEYKRDMNHNYLILTGDERIDTDSYQVRMIVPMLCLIFFSVGYRESTENSWCIMI